MNEALLHRGSVKDIYRNAEKELLFRFSDRYSIFDWGQMPDAIPGKGEALALMGKRIFEFLEKKGVRTHYMGAGKNKNELRVKEVSVPKGNESIYSSRPVLTLIPLEVIYRFGLPRGSSLLKRFKSDKDWTNAGFDRAYQEGERFSKVRIDFTTKLERIDRVLTATDAKSISGMKDEEWQNLLSATERAALTVQEAFAGAGFELWDGKFEFAFDEKRNPMLVDAVGLDEIRLTYAGKILSKEILRQFYLESEWYSGLTKAKETHGDQFKEHCVRGLGLEPMPLPRPVIEAVGRLYQAVAELVLGGADTRARYQDQLTQALSFLGEAT